jgi:hypothetical protein
MFFACILTAGQKPPSTNGETAASSLAIDPTEPRPDSSLAKEDSVIDETTRSETDSSRTDSVAEESKKPELQSAARKASTIKPVSFAKYQVVKNAPTGTIAKPAVAQGTVQRQYIFYIRAC